ncbi:hypothetical protein TSMEX_009743, partial [Taenia solium]
VYIGLNTVTCGTGLFREALYLERRPNHSQHNELAWTTCAASWTSQNPTPLHCIVTGTRAGGIALYNLPSDSQNSPWTVAIFVAYPTFEKFVGEVLCLILLTGRHRASSGTFKPFLT